MRRGRTAVRAETRFGDEGPDGPSATIRGDLADKSAGARPETANRQTVGQSGCVLRPAVPSRPTPWPRQPQGVPGQIRQGLRESCGPGLERPRVGGFRCFCLSNQIAGSLRSIWTQLVLLTWSVAGSRGRLEVFPCALEHLEPLQEMDDRVERAGWNAGLFDYLQTINFPIWCS